MFYVAYCKNIYVYTCVCVTVHVLQGDTPIKLPVKYTQMAHEKVSGFKSTSTYYLMLCFVCVVCLHQLITTTICYCVCVRVGYQFCGRVTK